MTLEFFKNGSRILQKFRSEFRQHIEFSYYLLWLVVVVTCAIANAIKVITRYRMLRLLLVETVIKLSTYVVNKFLDN